jgi:hypothetical protein
VKSRLLSCHGCEVSVATLVLQRTLAICSHCQVLTFYLWRNILFDLGWTIEPQEGNFEASREALLHDLASLAVHCRVWTGRAECFNTNESHDIVLEMGADCLTISYNECSLLHLQILSLSWQDRAHLPLTLRCRFNTSHLASRVIEG